MGIECIPCELYTESFVVSMPNAEKVQCQPKGFGYEAGADPGGPEDHGLPNG